AQLGTADLLCAARGSCSVLSSGQLLCVQLGTADSMCGLGQLLCAQLRTAAAERLLPVLSSRLQLSLWFFLQVVRLPFHPVNCFLSVGPSSDNPGLQVTRHSGRSGVGGGGSSD
ncbi:hypothetical protein LEMLEM_LOCUS26850, partial [Lemmus lemmus]